MSAVFERFRSTSSGAQAAIVAAGALLLAVILGAIWYWGFHTSYAPLFSGTRATDAATIVAELDRQKIPYRLADGGTTILVPEDKVNATRLSVMSEDLPLKGTVGFELFNKSELGLTDFAQKINYQRALQGELVRTIMTLDGVESVRVHLALGEDRLFREDRTPPRASVTVRMRNGTQLSDNATFGIQRLVSAAVPKLDVSDVVVLDEHGNVVSAAPVVDANGIPAPLAQQRAAVAQYYEAQIRALLGQRFPGRPIEIAVSMAGVADSATDLPSWNPTARAFPLRVVVEPSWSPDGNTQEQMRDLIAGAIGFDAGLGDEILFGPVPRIAKSPAPFAPGRPAALASPNYQPTAPIDAQGPADFGIRIAAMVLIGAMGIFALFLMTRKKPAPAVSGPNAFADQLKAALAEEDGHARSDA